LQKYFTKMEITLKVIRLMVKDMDKECNIMQTVTFLTVIL